MEERGLVILKEDVHSPVNLSILSLSFRASRYVVTCRSFCRE